VGIIEESRFDIEDDEDEDRSRGAKDERAETQRDTII
jgi:hypothetical protein